MKLDAASVISYLEK